MKKILAFDVETSGRSLSRNELVAIGACVLDKGTVIKEKRFTIFPLVKENELNPDSDINIDDYVWEERCKTEFLEKGDTKVKIQNALNDKENNVRGKRADVIPAFVEWLYEIEQEYQFDLQIVTDNPSFDETWVSYVMDLYGYPPLSCFKTKIDDPAHQYVYEGVVDLSTIVMTSNVYERGTMEEYWSASNLSWNKRKNPFKHDHDPLNDARHIGFKASNFFNSVPEVGLKKRKLECIESSALEEMQPEEKGNADTQKQ